MSNELQAIDVTRLAEFTKKIQELGSINKMMAPQYLRDFVSAMDLTSSMLSKAVKANLDAKSELEKYKAIAYLDKAEAYCNIKEIKMSNGVREMYVDIDDDVIKAKDKFAATEAMVIFLKNKHQAFRASHDDVRKMTYDVNKDTSWEGF
jgi:hypothetical protein